MDRSQYILVGGASLILLYQIIKGWSLGVVRQLARLGALAAAYAAGLIWGKPAVPFLRSLGYPDFVLQALGGFLVGFFVYVVIAIFARILFKRTADQEFGLTWFVYGVTGALLGVGFGLVIIFVAATSIRVMGSLAEGISTPAAQTSPGQRPATSAPTQNQRLLTPMMGELVGLKHALESGATGETLQMVDPIPKSTYDTTRKMGAVSANPEACLRFLSFPGAKELAARPEVAALQDDPEIKRAIAARRFGDLLKNPRLLKVANNPKIEQMLKKFEFEKALDYALAK